MLAIRVLTFYNRQDIPGIKILCQWNIRKKINEYMIMHKHDKYGYISKCFFTIIL